MKRPPHHSVVLVFVVALGLLVAGVVWAAWPPEQPPAPAPVPTVVVNPATVPITPAKDATGPKPGTIPDNGATPPDAQAPPADPVQIVEDGLGGNIKYVTGGTKNPWTPEQAVAYAAGQVSRPDKNYYNLCAHFMSWTYGYGGYGYESAKAGGLATPKSIRRSAKDRFSIPAGAIVYFVGADTGRYGHVVISNGDGTVFSNDIVSRGRISRVSLSLFKARWGMTPSFWTPPYFPAAFGRNPNPAPKIAPPPKPGAPIPSVGARVNPGGTVPVGTGIWSPNGAYVATMQRDGNFVVYGKRGAIWSSRTHRHPRSVLRMQRDGNLVIYQGSRPLWSSRTQRHPGAYVTMQNDGNLVIYRGRALWSSKYGRR